MRALPATSLIAVMILAASAHAQRPQLLGFLNTQQADRQSQFNQPFEAAQEFAEPKLAHVDEVDISDFTVPDDLSSELVAALGHDEASDKTLASRTLPPATKPGPSGNQSVARASFEFPSGQPVYGDAIVHESFVADPGAILDAGQPYDMPIGDVIPADAAETYSTNNWFRGGRWYSQQDFVLLLRTDMPPVHIAAERTATDETNAGTDAGGNLVVVANATADPATANALSSHDADFTYEVGTRLTIGKILGRDVANRDHSLEFRYFGLFDYTGLASISQVNPNDSRSPDDPDGLTILDQEGIDTLLGTVEANSTLAGVGFVRFNPVAGFDDSTSQQVRYDANLNSVEMNYMIGARPARDRLVLQPDGRWVRHATPSRVRGMFAGLRYIRQHERFLYTADGRPNLIGLGQGTNVISANTGAVQRRGEYQVDTDNDLFGIQLGSEWVQKRTDWVFGAEGRIGGLLNFANRQSRLVQMVDQDPGEVLDLLTTTRTQELDEETLTFLAEVHLYLAYYLRPNTSVRLGYNVMYLNGMATAMNNIGLIGDFPKFELTGDSLYHGATVGFNMTW